MLTCLIALIAVTAVSGRRPPPLFVAAALVASVAIDLDHLPAMLGWGGLTGPEPRPYTHSLVTVAILLGLGFLAAGRYRVAMLGLAFGVSAHLFRDLATGPGVSLALPVSTAAIRVPYFLYAALMALAAIMVRFRALPLLLAVILATTLAGHGDPATAATAAGPKGYASAPARQAKVAMGIYVPGADRDASRLDEYTAATGQQPAIVSSYRSWEEPPFEPALLQAVASRGAIPFVTWEPWDWDGNGYDLTRIAGGDFDPYIAAAAQAAVAWGGTIFVRFGHEMNGDWYPWGKSDPAVFKAAWRRVVSIFRGAGATNVRWVWTPYVNSGNLPFRRYYPGDAWVDFAGFDGFNWGRPFVSFAKVFDDSYRQMVRLTSKPLVIGETGSVEGAGAGKAIWIRRALTSALPRLTHIRALVWWSDVHPEGTDWRIDSSPSALEALGAGLRAPRYRQGPQFLLSVPGWLRR